MTVWQAFIYLFTALKNPGIVTARDITTPTAREQLNQPK